MYYINVYTRPEVEEFCKFLYGAKAPLSMSINGGEVFTLSTEPLKLYWLSGFQALIDNKV